MNHPTNPTKLSPLKVGGHDYSVSIRCDALWVIERALMAGVEATACGQAQAQMAATLEEVRRWIALGRAEDPDCPDFYKQYLN